VASCRLWLTWRRGRCLQLHYYTSVIRDLQCGHSSHLGNSRPTLRSVKGCHVSAVAEHASTTRIKCGWVRQLPSEGLHPCSHPWDTWWACSQQKASAHAHACRTRGGFGPLPSGVLSRGLAGVRMDTWRSRTWLGVWMGTWRSQTRLWGSESTAEGPEHLHLWDTWRHRNHSCAVEWVRGRWPGGTESDRRGLATQFLGA